MALFQRVSNPLARLRERDWKTEEERDALFREVQLLPKLGPKDLVWTLGSPDLDTRLLGTRAMARFGGAPLVEAFNEALVTAVDAPRRLLVRGVQHMGAADRHALVDGLLSDKQPARRALGLEVIQLLAAAPNLHMMMRLTAYPLPDVQLVVLRKLAETPQCTADRQLRVTLIRLAETGSDEMRIAALTLILAAPEKTAEMQVVVLQAMRDRNYTLQQLATQYMGGQLSAGNALLEASLIELLSDGRADLRSAVIKALLQSPDRRRVIRAYLSFTRTLAGWVRERALGSLKAFADELVGPIVELMNDADESIRRVAMLVGSTLEDPRCVPAIMKMATDPDWWTRITAAETLGRIGDNRAVPLLTGMLSDEDTRWASVEALGRIKDPSSFPRLVRLLDVGGGVAFLDDVSDDLRVAVVEAVAAFGPASARGPLEAVVQKDPSRRVRDRATQALAEMDRAAGIESVVRAGVPLRVAKPAAGNELEQLLMDARLAGGSDLHVAVGLPPSIRKVGEIKRLDLPPLTPEKARELLFSILSEPQRQRLEDEFQLDFCHTIREVGRYRGNIYRERKGWGGVFRVIPDVVPSLTELGLPTQLANLVDHTQGLIVVAGTAGSGKSTTLAALVNLVNERKHGHVLTIEDPIEFVHDMRNCLVNQRELGKHTQSFANALRGALRENPDVIVLGDLRDIETTRIALEAAETGHLVITTANTTTAARTVDSLIDAFPPDEQGQVRAALSETLKAVVCQSLLPHRTEPRRVVSVELLLTSASVRTLIREGRTHQINNAMQVGQQVGMRTQDMSLMELVKRNLIHPELAFARAVNKQPFEAFQSSEFLVQVRAAEAANAPTNKTPGAMPAVQPRPVAGSSLTPTATWPRAR